MMRTVLVSPSRFGIGGYLDGVAAPDWAGGGERSVAAATTGLVSIG
jgi:hypothetical protein